MAVLQRSGDGAGGLRAVGRPTHAAVPVGLVAAGLLTAVVALLAPPAQRVGVITAAQLGFAAAGVAGLAWLRPARPGPWLALLLGGLLYTAGWHALRVGAPLAVVVVLCCAAYACIVLLVRFTGGRRADHAGLEWFDVALLAVAASTVTAQLPALLAAVGVGGGQGSRASTWVAVQAAGSTGMVALVLWVQAGGRRRDKGMDPLLLTLGGLLAWHAATLVLHLRGGYVPGAATDVIVVLGWATLAAALWHPAHSWLGRPSPTDRPWVPSSVGTVTASTVLGLLPVLVAAGPAHLRMGWVVVGGVLLAGLLVARERVAGRNTARAVGSDPLTGLGNRTALLRHLVRHLARPQDGGAVLCLVDVDDFARVNEHLGHHTGDQVLEALARRLQQEARGASAHRLAGDTFAVVVPCGQVEADAPHPVTARLLAALQEPIAAGPPKAPDVELSVTIGEAVVAPLGPLDRDDPAALDDEAVAVVQRAELALSDARRRGARSSRATQDVVDRHARYRRLVAELPGALARGEVVPHYQVQVDLCTGGPIGVEALARWEHPELGVLQPAEVLPVAEQLGVLDQVDSVIMRRSLHDLAGWRAGDALLGDLRVAVNASAASLRRPDVVAQVVDALTAAGLPGPALEVEITESASLDDREGLEETLAELQELGVAIAIDDFGSGYASMDYLVRFRADTIKVDRSLVRRVDTPTGARMLTALVALTHDLGALILAEGAEDDSAVEAVRALGFDLVQGFAHGLPGPAPHVPRALLAILAGSGTPGADRAPGGRASLPG